MFRGSVETARAWTGNGQAPRGEYLSPPRQTRWWEELDPACFSPGLRYLRDSEANILAAEIDDFLRRAL